MLAIDSRHQSGYLTGILVSNDSRGARSASRTDTTGFFDRLWPAVRGAPATRPLPVA